MIGGEFSGPTGQVCPFLEVARRDASRNADLGRAAHSVHLHDTCLLPVECKEDINELWRYLSLKVFCCISTDVSFARATQDGEERQSRPFTLTVPEIRRLRPGHDNQTLISQCDH